MAVLLTLHIDSFGIQFHIEQTAINEFEKIQNKMKKNNLSASAIDVGLQVKELIEREKCW